MAIAADICIYTNANITIEEALRRCRSTCPNADARSGRSLHAAPDRRRARQVRRRPGQGQARRRDRAAQPHAAAEAAGRAGRGGRAEEHPDDRADRRRQDRDRAAAGAARAVAVHQGRGVEVHRGRLRRPRRRVDGARPGRARRRHGARGEGSTRCARRRSRTPKSGCSTCCCRPRRPWPDEDPARRACASARSATREKLREQLRDGRLDRAHGRDRRPRAVVSVLRDHRRARRSRKSDINIKDMLPGAVPGDDAKRRTVKVPEALELPGSARSSRSSIDMESVARTAVERVEQARHHLRRRDRQDRRARRRPRPRRQPRRRAARHPADRRGHDRQHEVRDGADRSHPVHRGRRVPRLEALGPDPRAAGAVPDPRRARAARPRRLRPHPDRAAERARQAVHRAAGDRGRRRSTSPPTPSTASRTSRRW